MTGQYSETVRNTFVEGLNEPESAFPWIEDPEAAEKFIAEATK